MNAYMLLANIHKSHHPVDPRTLGEIAAMFRQKIRTDAAASMQVHLTMQDLLEHRFNTSRVLMLQTIEKAKRLPA